MESPHYKEPVKTRKMQPLMEAVHKDVKETSEKAKNTSHLISHKGKEGVLGQGAEEVWAWCDTGSSYNREGLGYRNCTTCSYGTSKISEVSYREGKYFSCLKDISEEYIKSGLWDNNANCFI